MYLSGKLGSSPDDTNAYAASMLFACDRYISYRCDWKADCDDEDTVVIANRYTTSNALHQLSKLPREEWDGFIEWLFDFEFSKLSLPAPDTVIYLSVPTELSMKSVAKRSEKTGQARDIHELDRDYMSRSHMAGLYAADKLGWKIIDCADGNGSLRERQDIFEDIRSVLGI
ncbi:MAG: thymidylate kinase, partial [Firmicutes bacterium]|nr:thymidylate kinase [Bacillota bacterium]